MPNLGDRINRTWRAWVRKNIDARRLRQELNDIEWGDDDLDDPLYFYVVAVIDGRAPSIESVEGPMTPGFFQGVSRLDGRTRLVGVIPVHRELNKRELLDFDLADDVQWWDATEED